MNARRESKERNLTWRIQEDRNCWTLLEHFLESISFILYVAREVRNPTLQTVRESELKWRSYSHWKPITPSWRPISQLRNHKVLAAKSTFGCKMETFSLQNFTASTLWFSSQRLISQLQNWPSAWCDWLSMAITSSFQFWFTHHLKCWISDFPSFEMTYSMHEMDSRKCSKSVQQLLSSWILHVRFLSLLSLLAFMICL